MSETPVVTQQPGATDPKSKVITQVKEAFRDSSHNLYGDDVETNPDYQETMDNIDAIAETPTNRQADLDFLKAVDYAGRANKAAVEFAEDAQYLETLDADSLRGVIGNVERFAYAKQLITNGKEAGEWFGHNLTLGQTMDAVRDDEVEFKPAGTKAANEFFKSAAELGTNRTQEEKDAHAAMRGANSTNSAYEVVLRVLAAYPEFREPSLDTKNNDVNYIYNLVVDETYSK